jgi:type II secretory pathway pseudopilin PulG
MKTAIIVVIVAIVVIAGLFAMLGPRMRQRRTEQNQARAEEHLRESEQRNLTAQKAQAAADLQEAQARQEQIDAQLTASRNAQNARELRAEADKEQSAAAELRDKAAKLDPNLRDVDRGGDADTDPAVDLRYERTNDMRDERAADPAPASRTEP